jgi:DNA polymerase I-like protein with 3'-5' exonuclease and polymerase domains
MKPKLSIRSVKDDASFFEMLRDLRGAVSFDLETTGLYPWAKHDPKKLPKKWKKDPPDPRSYDADIKSIGFGTEKHQWVWLTAEYAPSKERLARVKHRLDRCKVIGHYAKFDLLWMRVIYQQEWDIDFDTGIAHYLLDENSFHGLKELAQKRYDAPDWDVDLAVKQGKGSREKLIKYHAYDLYYTRRLYGDFREELAQDPAIRRVFKKLLMPCVKIFTDAEFEGSYIDLSRMGEVEIELKRQIAAAQRKLEKWVPISKRGVTNKGEPIFNWGSPKQVGWLLFDKLHIKCPGEKGKAGNWPTNESVLKQIDHPLVKDLFDLRGAKQQLSFFIDGWKPYLVGPRIHPSFKLTGTVTGRLSCEHPNWQQVPRDKFIRTLLISAPGWVLIEADLSQVELRIAAELSGDEALIEAFVTGKDPHWITALRELQRGHGEIERVLKTANKLGNRKITDYDEAIEYLLIRGADAAIEVDDAWKELRKKAKAVNFGFLYGMWWKKFKIYARDKYDVHLTDEQAEESRNGFFATWRDLPDWHKRSKRFARRNGYVRYLSGRKRRLPGAMLEKECFEKGEAERQAVNSPVQGFANDINLMALIQLQEEFPKTIYRPIATVHDSILAYVRVEHAEKIARRTMEVMRRPTLFDDFEIEMRVPLEADVKIGPWGAGVSLNKWLKERENGNKK